MKISRLTSSVQGTPTASTKRHRIWTLTRTRAAANKPAAAASTQRLRRRIRVPARVPCPSRRSAQVRDLVRRRHRPELGEQLVDRRLRLGHERRVVRLRHLHAGFLELSEQRLLALRRQLVAIGERFPGGLVERLALLRRELAIGSIVHQPERGRIEMAGDGEVLLRLLKLEGVDLVERPVGRRDDAELQRGEQLRQRDRDDDGAELREGVDEGLRLAHADLDALEVVDRADRRVRGEVAVAAAHHPDGMNAALLEYLADAVAELRIPALVDMVLVAEHEGGVEEGVFRSQRHDREGAEDADVELAEPQRLEVVLLAAHLAAGEDLDVDAAGPL